MPHAPAPQGTTRLPAPAGPARPSRLAGPLLAACALTMGLMAGLFFAFDVSVMPGLARSDDRTYVEAMQNFNAVIDWSGLFGLIFVGALLTTGAAVFYEYRQGRRTVGRWLIVATVCSLLVLMLTMGVNIPLNNQLADGSEYQFAGGLWVTWSLSRAPAQRFERPSV
ncbi:DUF1772 domain-containing protein [Streptomyces bluensis]|uniref:anthrone oxygenase family protein n=1 Tax=Streptomyces bluensis TaxID=33897 RepID=UPI0033268E0C